jgi:hypothetical protein
VALSPPYDGYLKADLEAEAERRGIDVSDDPLKSELVARLEESDVDQTTASEAPASAETFASPPEPLPTDVTALGAVQQAVAGHKPTPYPSDDDLRNRLTTAFTPETVAGPPPIEDLTFVGSVNVDEVNIDQSTRND